MIGARSATPEGGKERARTCEFQPGKFWAELPDFHDAWAELEFSRVDTGVDPQSKMT